MYITVENERILRLRLKAIGMAVAVPEEQVPRHLGRHVVAGLFTVPHKADHDRLIIDKRPRNAMEGRLAWARLPHGSQLCGLRLGEDETLRGSADDLSNYFYLLRHESNNWGNNAFGRAFSGEAAAELGLDPTRKYYMCLTVVAMGDHNAVDIAQACHERVLEKHGCLKASDKLVYGENLPDSDVLEGVYVDDHLVIGRIKKNDLNGERRDLNVLRASRAAYTGANLPLSNKSYEDQDRFVAWGTEVQGDAGLVGVPASKRLQLSILALELCCQGVVTKSMARGLLGLFIHPFCHRRELMCVFQRSFVWVNSLDDDQVVHKIPADILDEWLMAALCMGIAFSDIRLPVDDYITCSDATPSAGGVVGCAVSPAFADLLYDSSDEVGYPARLDAPGGRGASPEDLFEVLDAVANDPSSRQPLAAGMLDGPALVGLSGVPFDVTFARDFKET